MGFVGRSMTVPGDRLDAEESLPLAGGERDEIRGQAIQVRVR
jgi:hypothetical protein